MLLFPDLHFDSQAHLRLASVVEKDDVSEAMMLMEMSKQYEDEKGAMLGRGGGGGFSAIILYCLLVWYSVAY